MVREAARVVAVERPAKAKVMAAAVGQRAVGGSHLWLVPALRKADEEVHQLVVGVWYSQVILLCQWVAMRQMAQLRFQLVPFRQLAEVMQQMMMKVHFRQLTEATACPEARPSR